MKKVLLILVLIVMLVSVCACNYIPSNKFMSNSQVKSLVKEYGTPQAELTINYQLNSTEYEIKIKYNLLLSQTPLAVIRFIQLAENGFYNGTVIDTYNSTNNYMILGRYSNKESAVSEGKKFFYQNKSDVTFKGEFKSNNYRQPANGYAQFKIFSLAMFHDSYKDEKTTNFDTANGTLILATANESLNSNNYAVFAEMVSVSYKIGDKSATVYEGKVPSDARNNLTSQTGTEAKTVYSDATDEMSTSVSMLKQLYTVHVKILGNNDWSKLPQIGR